MATPVMRLRSGTEYRVLCVKQPWAWAIVHGGKDVENRTWRSPYRGLVLIHASSPPKRAYLEEDLEEVSTRVRRQPAAIEKQLLYGAILGAVDLVDIVDDSESPWALDAHEHWLFENPRRLDEPFALKGKLNLWRWVAP